MSDDLKPCPFCGESAEFMEGADDDGQWVAVGCTGCGAGSRQHYPVMDDARPHAQSAWNSRDPFASSAAGQREGWKLVPVLPTDEMLEAGGGMIPGDEVDRTAAGIVWCFMLAASPSAPEERRDEVERLREALAPFAKLGGPINGEADRISYVDAIGGDDAGEELLLTTHVGNGRRSEILYAEDFRRARTALNQSQGER